MQDAWRHLLGALVIAHLAYVGITPLPLADGASEAGRAWNELRNGMRRVGRPYGTHLGTRQTWHMFAAPGRTNGRVEIAVQVDGAWQPVFIERDSDATWNRHVFAHYRWREMLGRFHKDKEKRSFRAFVRWVAPQVFALHPEADVLRVRVMKARLPEVGALQQKRRLHFDRRGQQLQVRRQP